MLPRFDGKGTKNGTVAFAADLLNGRLGGEAATTSFISEQLEKISVSLSTLRVPL